MGSLKLFLLNLQSQSLLNLKKNLKRKLNQVTFVILEKQISQKLESRNLNHTFFFFQSADADGKEYDAVYEAIEEMKISLPPER